MVTLTSQRQVVSISLMPTELAKLERIRKKGGKSRSQMIRDLIDKYETDLALEQVYKWGEQAANEFNIKSEEDVLRIIND